MRIQKELNKIKQGIKEKEKYTLQQDLVSVQSRLSFPKEIDEKRKQLEDEMEKFEMNYKNCQKNLQKKSPTEQETELQQLKEQFKKVKQLQEELDNVIIKYQLL